MPAISHKIPCGDNSPVGSINKKEKWCLCLSLTLHGSLWALRRCKNCNNTALFRRYSHLTYVFTLHSPCTYAVVWPVENKIEVLD